MSGRTSLEIKKLILDTLKDSKPHSYAELEKKVNTNWQTVREHCRELEIFDCVVIVNKPTHEKNNKPYSEITITKKGLEVLKKI
jgi:predicted transcriptional regulator